MPKGAEPPAAAARNVPISAQRWVLAGLLCAVILNLGHIALWCLPLATGAAAWRIWAAQQPSRLLGRAARIAVVVVLTLAVLISFRTLNGLDAGATLLVAMAAIKLMETQRRRDWLIVLGTALFLLLAACLGAQSLWLMPFYAAELWLLSTALYALGAGETLPESRSLLRASARSLLLALPLAVLLFLFFPRLPGSLWTVPKDEEAVTGLGDQMDPGSIGKLVQSDEPALRARFVTAPPRREDRYWRGIVLHHFDGTTWRRAQRDFGQPLALEFAGPDYRYEITLEPGTHGTLIALDMPHGAPEDSIACAPQFRRSADRLQAHRQRHQLPARILAAPSQHRGAAAADATARPGAAAGAQPAQHRAGASAARRGARRSCLRAGRARLSAEQRLRIHLDAAHARRQFDRRSAVRHSPGILRPLCLRIRDADAGRRRSSARGHRLSRRRVEPYRRLSAGTTIQRACLDRSVAR